MRGPLRETKEYPSRTNGDESPRVGVFTLNDALDEIEEEGGDEEGGGTGAADEHAYEDPEEQRLRRERVAVVHEAPADGCVLPNVLELLGQATQRQLIEPAWLDGVFGEDLEQATMATSEEET